MILLCYAFCGERHALDQTPVRQDAMTYLSIEGGAYDELYATHALSDYGTQIPELWDNNTVMHALFENSLSAGNISYVVNDTNRLRLKRRESNTFDWITLWEIPIENSDSFKIVKTDRYAASGVSYDYAIVPVSMDGEEGNFSYASVTSAFDGLFLMEPDSGVSTLYDVSVSCRMNKPSSVVSTLGGTYPYVISSGSAQYCDGSVSASFVNDTGGYETWPDTNRVLEFLANGRPKLLKTDDGKTMLVTITGEPQQSASDHRNKVNISFNWVQTGQADSTRDLYGAGLIDIDVEGS